MSEQTLKDELIAELGRRGCRAGIVPMERLAVAADEFEDMRSSGAIVPALYEKWLSGLRFEAPEELPSARSVIVAATPRPLDRFTFEVGTRELKAIVPPSYLHGVRERDRIRGILADTLGMLGFTVADAAVPKKRLAVESGVARYGRNNIAYVEGMGSFLRLDAFVSNLPCGRDEWHEPQVMTRCRTCTACMTACPTGAIPRDRFLLRAERCVTFHNEEENDVPFPDWIGQSVHHCLVGCMRCQAVCPENAAHLDRVEDRERFEAKETELLAKGVTLEKLPPETAEKLERSDLVGVIECMGRNLNALIENEATRRPDSDGGATSWREESEATTA